MMREGPRGRPTSAHASSLGYTNERSTVVTPYLLTARTSVVRETRRQMRCALPLLRTVLSIVPRYTQRAPGTRGSIGRPSGHRAAPAATTVGATASVTTTARQERRAALSDTVHARPIELPGRQLPGLTHPRKRRSRDRTARSRAAAPRLGISPATVGELPNWPARRPRCTMISRTISGLPARGRRELRIYSHLLGH